MTPVEILLSRLENPKRSGQSVWMAKCCAHDDRSPSLSIRELDDGRVLIHCFAGCGAADVMTAVGLTLADLFPDGVRGEFSSKPYRAPENVPYSPTYRHMVRQIDVLRAKLSSK